MSMKRRNRSPEFQLKVTLADVKGDQTLSELLLQYRMSFRQTMNWHRIGNLKLNL